MAAGAHLWERDGQRAAAAATLAAARDGRGRALFFLGEAGLGKTALLDEICGQADDDLVVARAYCDPMEAALPFGVLTQIVHDLGGTDPLGVPAADQTEASTDTLYRMLRWLEEVAQRPLLIAIDDLQWCDPDSLTVVGFLARRLARLPAALVASLRPWPAAPADLAWSLAHRGDAAVELLPPLSEEAAAAVLAERLGRAAPTELARRAWRLTGGNPLLLGLTAGRLGDQDIASTDVEALPLSDVERSLVLTHFASLTPDGTRWARAAAVLGVEFHPELVSGVAGLEDDAADAGAEAVWRCGLVRTGRKGRVEFVHPLFGQLLYEDIAPSVRTSLHARAFTALTARGMDDLAAEHAIRANLAGDARAVRVLTEAGRRALRGGAPATAASRLEAAVRLSGDGAGAPLLELGEAFIEAGRAPEATATLIRALAMDLSLVQRVTAHTMLSRAHFGRGELESAGAALQAAVALAEQDYPEAVVVPLARQATAVMMTAGPAASLPLAARARELARSSGQPLQGRASAAWGMFATFCGDPEGLVVAEAEGRRVRGAGAAEVAADLRLGILGILAPLAVVAAYTERFAEAGATFRIGIEEAERAGAVTTASALGIPYGFMLARTRSGDVLAVADRLLAWADLVPLAEPFARTLRSYELLQLGDDEESEAEHARAYATASAFGIWLSGLWLDHIEGVRRLRRARFRAASQVYLQLEERYRSLGVGEPCTVPFGRHAIVAHTQAGRREDAERVVGWLDERGSVLPCRWPVAAAAAGRASLAQARGELDEADKAYRTAVELLDDTSLPLDQAEILIDHGRVLRRDGRPREARESFRRAAELAESAGGVWLARLAGEELAAAGGRRRARRGATELTPQEERTARLAATGASDKDIASHLSVSVRTVRTHLEHVYAKLDIHSRRELMAMGDRLEERIGGG